MARKLSSVTTVELTQATKSANSVKAVMRNLGLPTQGGTLLSNVRDRILENNIDVSHFQYPIHNRLGNRYADIKDALKKGLTHKTSWLKKRLIKEGLLINICYECGQNSFWNGKELVLQLHHINGERSDNRLVNLNILCPNCHTQTTTYVAKNKRKVNRTGVPELS